MIRFYVIIILKFNVIQSSMMAYETIAQNSSSNSDSLCLSGPFLSFPLMGSDTASYLKTTTGGHKSQKSEKPIYRSFNICGSNAVKICDVYGCL